MSAPLLTIDRGNTTLDCAVVGDATEPLRRRLSPGDAEALRELVAAGGATAAVGCTVVRDGLREARGVLEALGVPLAVAGEDLPCPMELRYREPGALGVDRWVAALAAWREQGAAVVVDCGTAITVDAVSSDGAFLGGAIAPGPSVCARALTEAAPALPAAELEGELGRGLPSRPVEAVTAGVVLGFCGAVERLVAAVTEAAGLRDPSLVLTGGHAALYLRHGRLVCTHVPDLVHRGLRHLWSTRDDRG